MKPFLPSRAKRLSLLTLAFLALSTASCFSSSKPSGNSDNANAPHIDEVEPPNWWTSFSPDLMLLLTGTNLDSTEVTTSYPGVHILKTQQGASDHHLFVWMQLAPAVSAGQVRLHLRTHSGKTEISFPLLSRAASQAQPQGFSPNDVIYLIMPDRFADGDPRNDQPPQSTGTYDRNNPMAYHGGDLRGIRERLPYLHDLGVTALWMTPVWKNTDSDYHGYHVVDFYAIDDHMGTLQEYRDLVADAHKQGIKVLIDYVPNHTGPKDPWITDPPTATWFHGMAEKHLQPVYNFSGLVDPHASAREYRGTLEGWFVDRLPDLNPDDPLLAKYLAENALWWTETAALDGFRLDTFPYSSRRFWSGWHKDIFRVYPHTATIGEVADRDPTVTSFFQGGRAQFDGVDSRASTVFDFPLYNAMRDVIVRGQPMQKIIDVLQRDSLYPRPDLLVTFFGNHDQRRFMSEDGSSKDKLKAAFSLLLTMRGVPQIYAGDEIGMPGGDDPDNRRDFPGGFPGDSRNAFSSAGRSPDEQEIFAHAQSLLRLRQAHPALRTGTQWHIGWDDSYYAFVRESPEEKLLVIFNNAASPRELQIPIEDTPLASVTRFENLFGPGQVEVKDKAVQAKLPAMSLSVYRVH